jgi:hypothetical protein
MPGEIAQNAPIIGDSVSFFGKSTKEHVPHQLCHMRPPLYGTVRLYNLIVSQATQSGSVYLDTSCRVWQGMPQIVALKQKGWCDDEKLSQRALV